MEVLRRSKSKSFNFQIIDSSNNIVDLTGATVKRIDVSRDELGYSESIILTKELAITNETKGLCNVTFITNEMILPLSKYKYILTFDLGAGEVVYQTGYFLVKQNIDSRIVDIKSKFGLSFDDPTMQNAISWAHEQINSNAFNSEKGTNMITDVNNILELGNYVMDNNYDGIIDINDIEIREYLNVSPYTVNDLSEHVSSILFDHPSGKTFLTMDGSYPTSNYVLEIKYSRASKPYVKAYETISYLEELYILKHLFMNLEIYQLQRGMTSRSINGVDITFDKQAIDEFIATLQVWITNEILKIRPFTSLDLNGFGDSSSPLARSIQINKGY